MKTIFSIVLFLTFCTPIITSSYFGFMLINNQIEYSCQSESITSKQAKSDVIINLFLEEKSEEDEEKFKSTMLFAIVYCLDFNLELDRNEFQDYESYSDIVETTPLFIQYCSLRIPQTS